jgi:hypothetical protein
MKVVVDIISSASGRWSLAAHDLPDYLAPSATIVGESADVHDDPGRTVDAATRLVLDAAAPSSYAARALDDGIASMYVYLYQPRDLAELTEFERRIEPRYADYYAGLAAYYSGIFTVAGLGEGYVGEFIGFERGVDAAREFINGHEPSPDIVTIEDECTTLQRLDAPRHLLWLGQPGADV